MTDSSYTVRHGIKLQVHFDAVEMKRRKWILQTFQYEEKTISEHYTETRNIEKRVVIITGVLFNTFQFVSTYLMGNYLIINRSFF